MLADTFSHGMIRNYVVAFGTLFNNIKINRRASSGESASTIAVPLAYAPRQRFIERIVEDYNLDKPVAMSLPRMSFEMMGLTYSTERKLNTMQRFKRPKTTSNTKIDAVYSPVPYDLTFQLSIYISNIEDGTHIVEQILPYFTPEFTLSLKGVTDIGIPNDIPIILNSVSTDDSYEGGYDDRRIIIWTLDFTLKGNLYGPISQTGIINKSIINFVPSTNTAITANANTAEQLITQAAQFANGVATNSAAMSVSPNLINANSDFGIAQDIYPIETSPDIFKFWGFESSTPAGITWGEAVGNTTIDGIQAREYLSNGTVGLSSYYDPVYGGVLRHTATKDTTNIHANTKFVTLQVYSNSAGYFFEPFYGKNYQTVELRYRVKQSTGSGAVMSPQGHLRWLTTNSGEDGWSTGSADGSTHRFRLSQTAGHVNPGSAISSATGTYTYTWDMTKYNNGSTPISQWDDRIITALEFNVLALEDHDGECIVETDIDYIKIST